MDSIVVVYSQNTPGHPEWTEETVAIFESELGSEFQIKTFELPTYYGGDDYELPDRDTLEAELRDCVAIFAQPGDLSRTVIEAAPNLKVIATMGSGYGRVDIEAATDNGVVVTHNPEAPAPWVAEYTLMAIISLLRQIKPKSHQLSQGAWDNARQGGQPVRDSTVGLVGVGQIGYKVAQLVDTFDATLVAYDPYLDGTTESRIYPRHDRETVDELGIEFHDLRPVCQLSDVLSLHVPNNTETRGMISDAELDALGPDGYLINTSRGPIVDEAALIAAIRDNTIAGAAVDVFDSEPPDRENPLLHSDRVIATPHIAGLVERDENTRARLGAKKIRQVLAGDPPDTLVNPAVFDSQNLRVPGHLDT